MSESPRTRAVSTRSMWVASAGGVTVAAFRTRAELQDWLADVRARQALGESSIRVPVDKLVVEGPVR